MPGLAKAAAPTIRSELERARALLAQGHVDEPRLTAEALLAHVLDADRVLRILTNLLFGEL